MKARIRTCALLVSCIAASLTFGASSALAAAQEAITGNATSITPTSAVLTGAVVTNGAETAWEFLYGPTETYGRATPVAIVPPGKPGQIVVATVAGLQPATTYHFLLAAIAPVGSYYYFAPLIGKDVTFTTQPIGRLTLTARPFPVKHGHVKIGLNCGSSVACNGSLTVTTNGAQCAAGSFALGAGASVTLRPKLSGACKKLLAAAPGHKLRAHISTTLTTGQPGPNRGVKLVRI